MTPLLRAELIKLRTTRTFAALAGVAVGTSLLITVLVAALTEPTADTVVTDVFLTDISSLFVMILAIVGITGEWRHRTITSSLLAAPHRIRFLAAKTVAYAIAGLLLALMIWIAVIAVGLAIVILRDLPRPDAGELGELASRTIAVALLPGAFGVALGSILRNPAVAVVFVLLLAFVIEPTLGTLAPEVARWGPTGALPAAVAGIDADDALVEGVDLVAPGVAILALLAWIGSLFAVGATLLRIRDID